MSKQNKFAGSFGKTGDTASGGSKVQGGNVYKAPDTAPQPKAKVGMSQNVINTKTGPGDNMGTQKISTHNDINAFTRGIKSRGPYGGPAFSSFNHYKTAAQGSNTGAISKFSTPSGSTAGGTRGTAGGSSSKSGGSKVGSGHAQMSQMAKGPRNNKVGSGHMASV